MDAANNTTVNFRINSWMENAGIVGLMRILKNDPRYLNSYSMSESAVKFDPKVLDNFSDLYFKFFIKNYGQVIRYSKIINEENWLRTLEDKDFREFDEKDLKRLTDWFDNIVKYSANSASYKKVIKFINSDFDVKAEVKKIGRASCRERVS